MPSDLCRRVRDGATPSLPVIVRHATTHGGDMMELVDAAEALLGFAEDAGERMLYLTDYVDYAPSTALFRKYRFLLRRRRNLPYHLAIGDGWKVRHARPGWARWNGCASRSKRFLPIRQASSVAGHGRLETIRRQIGLDYCGIDCSVDAEGRVVLSRSTPRC